MKRIILFCLVSLLLVNIHIQAQRHYKHFQRVRVDQQIITHDSIPVKETRNTSGIIDKSENSPVIVSTLPVVQQNVVFAPVVKKKQKVFIDQDIKEQVSSQAFLYRLLEQHKRLNEIKEIKGEKKTMLRTWLWLFLAACVLLVLGIVFLIIGYYLFNKGKNGTSFIVIGYTSGSIGFLGGLIVLILGLSGRI